MEEEEKKKTFDEEATKVKVKTITLIEKIKEKNGDSVSGDYSRSSLHESSVDKWFVFIILNMIYINI